MWQRVGKGWLCNDGSCLCAPLHLGLCRYWDGSELWGHFSCLKADADVFFLLYTCIGGRGYRPVVDQRCEYLQLLAFLLSLGCRSIWETLGLVFHLFCLLVFHQPLYKHLLVKQKSVFKKNLVFYLLCVGSLTTLLCCTGPLHRVTRCCCWQSLWSTVRQPHCSRGEEPAWLILKPQDLAITESQFCY